jgi:hypothetical protein
MPFVKGESGNPAGRPPGARNAATLRAEAFLNAHWEELARTLVNLANGGHSTALRLSIDRIMPRGASRPIIFELPRVDSAKAAREAVADVIQGMTTAQLAPREGNEMLRVLERGAKIIATAEAAEAVAREGQPRHIQVSWVDPKEKKQKWKDYWKERYRDAYEARCGPLPELPDPEEDGWLPPEKEPADAPGVPADRASGPADPAGTPPAPPPPPPAVAGGGAGNNENNDNNRNTTDAARLAAGASQPVGHQPADRTASADRAGARRQDGDPLLPPSASPLHGHGARNKQQNNDNNESTMDGARPARPPDRCRD